MQCFSFPFRLGANGQFVKVEQGSEEYRAELIASLVMTLPGEVPLQPTFGMPDPVPNGINMAEVAAKVAAFGPAGVTVTGVNVTWDGDNQSNVVVTFDD